MSHVWRHIGLHGHSVGTFAVDSNGIQWKSALTASEDVSTSRNIPASQITGAEWTLFGRSGHLRIQTNASSLKHELRFDGFPPSDFEKLKGALEFIKLERLQMSSVGASFGNVDVNGRKLVFRQAILEDADEEGEEFEPRDGPELMSLDLTEISQCVLPGTNRNEIEVQFPESDTVEAGTDQLVGLRFYVPPDPDADPEDPSPAELLQQRIMKTANIKNTTGNVIVEFDETKGTFLTPRGRYTIELYDRFLRMRGNKYDYKIKYDDISRLFLLPKPDDVHTAFVISLDKPIRQGQQRYQHLVLQTTKETSEVTVNLDEKVLQKEYNGDLQPIMHGSLSNLVAKTFKVICRKKVFIPGKFANANQQACVKCALRANEGLLYPLEKQFIFIHKPPVLIRFDEVESVEFQRYAGGQGSTRNFDLCVTLKDDDKKEYVFSGIDRSDYTGLYNFLSTKKIRIKNLENIEAEEKGPQAPVYNEDEIYGIGGDDLDEGSEDEDYDVEEKESGSSDDDMDSDDMGSEVDEDLDSDIEEARKASKKKKNRSEQEDSDDEAPKKKKKKASPSSPKGSPKKQGKKKKDPNAPKRAMTAYILYGNAVRTKLKAENPDISFGDLTRRIVTDYKALSPEERIEWDDKAAKERERYQEEMAAYSAPEQDDDISEDEAPTKKAPKKKKDKKAPKKALSAYNYYMAENRDRIKEENPDVTFGEIAKLVGAQYKSLTSEEKEKYNAMAEKDKERFKEEMANYVPSDADENPKAKKAQKKKTVEKKKAGEKKKAVEKKVDSEEDSDDSDDDEDLVVDDSDEDNDDDSD